MDKKAPSSKLVKILHKFGLTNLSEEQIQKYENIPQEHLDKIYNSLEDESEKKYYKLSINVKGKRNCFFFEAKDLKFIGVEDSIFQDWGLDYTFGQITKNVIDETEHSLGLEIDQITHYYQGKDISDNPFDF